MTGTGWFATRRPHGRHRIADLPDGYRPSTPPAAAAAFLAEVRAEVAEPIGQPAPVPDHVQGVPVGHAGRVPLALHLGTEVDRSDGIWRA